ncbi:MAG: rhomboid family intramembrane serine protease [Leptolyngbya sp. PLA1]|nr:rhomboid family intramembrane serine protease [Leptolyngbya sp. PLA1]
MGIYDREYVFRKPARMGRPGLFSVNTWIILINAAVFFGGFMFKNLSVPVYIDTRVADPSVPATVRLEPAGPYLSTRGAGVGSPATTREVHTPGAELAKAVVRADTKEPVNGIARYRVEYPFHAYGHFSTYTLFKLEVWRAVTFQFLHASITHLLFNMLGLYFFGGMVEQYLGSKRYLAFYLVCGIAGALAYLLLNVAGYVALDFFGTTKIPGLLYNASTTPLVGASAGVFGVILACAFISPNSIVQLIFPPIPMKLRTMAFVYVGIAVLTVLFGGHNAGGEAAHLGGAVAGFFLIRRPHLLRDFFDVFTDSRKKSPERPPEVRATAARPPVRDEEVDRILAKVSAEGLHSLTAAERESLRRASESRRASGS